MNRSASLLLFAFTVTAVTGCGGTSSGSPSAAMPMGRHRPSSVWIPPAQSTFAIQYDGKLDLSVNADTYDLDGFDTKASVVQQLHGENRHVVCYISAGTWEDWR